MITKRQMKILRILHEREDFITLSGIAAVVGVSSKTVRNDLSVIREELSSADVLVTRPNKGIRLKLPGDEYQRLIRFATKKYIPIDYKSQRGLAVAVLLLKTPGVTLEQIGEALFLSRSAVNRAVAEAEKLLFPHGVSIQRGRGRKLSILYEEYGWRMALWDAFRMAERHGMMENGREDYFTPEKTCAHIGWFLDGFDVFPVMKILDRFERMHGFFFSYEARQLVLFHISACIFRSRKKRVRVPPPVRPGFDMEYDRLLADSLAQLIKEVYSFELPVEEKTYLQRHLSMADPKEFVNAGLLQNFQLQYPKISGMASRIIGLFSRILEIDFSSDGALYNNMFLTLRSTLARLSLSISVENLLLDQIKAKYPKILVAAWSASVILENETGLAVNENELGFLALHICGAVERTSFSSHVLILCNYGVGVSRLMKVRLENAVAGATVDDVISVQDEQRAKCSNCDFIISSCPVEGNFGGKEVVVVDNFLPPSDIAVIREKMQSIHRRKKQWAFIGELDETAGRGESSLFDSRFVRIGVRGFKKEDLLRQMCGELQQAGFVTPGYVDSVLSREEATSTEVAEGVAIPHGCTKFVLRSVISVAVLEEPVAWCGENPVDVIFLLAFSMTEKKNGQEALLRFYSAFASLLENEERMKTLRRIGSSDEFARYMNAMVKGDGRIP